jgi:hypothetical protein
VPSITYQFIFKPAVTKINKINSFDMEEGQLCQRMGKTGRMGLHKEKKGHMVQQEQD